MNSGLIGKYVVVRCRDAGVHAGILEAHEGREALLREARRLWYWKPAKGKFLSAVAMTGLHPESKVGMQVGRQLLTEDCEIMECSPEAAKSIQGAPND